MRPALGLVASMAVAGAGAAAEPGAFVAKAETLVAKAGAFIAKDGVFVAEDWGLQARYPAGVIVRDTFHPNFFDRGAWRVSYAADVGIGTPIVAFALPDLHASDAAGDATASAELRIGASRDPGAVRSCQTYGMNSGDNVETAEPVVGGVRFTEVPDNGDGHGARSIRTDDLRAVHEGTCWAIDLVRSHEGTSNARPDYTAAQIATLRAILTTLRFEGSSPLNPGR